MRRFILFCFTLLVFTASSIDASNYPVTQNDIVIDVPDMVALQPAMITAQPIIYITSVGLPVLLQGDVCYQYDAYCNSSTINHNNYSYIVERLLLVRYQPFANSVKNNILNYPVYDYPSRIGTLTLHQDPGDKLNC